MANFQLTQQQLNFVETFGYLHFPGLLNDRIDQIIEAFEQVWVDLNVEHPEAHRTYIVPFIGQSEYLSSLLDDDRIDGIFTSLLGEDYVYLGSDGNFYSGDTGWHSDGGWPRPVRYYKMGLYLDPLTADSGALRFIPGSHRYGEGYAETVQQNIRSLQEIYSIDGPAVPAAAIETQPGDVVVFNQGMKHSAWGGGTQRRMFTINCGYRYKADEMQLLRDELDLVSRFGRGKIYGDKMLATAGPKRMVHLEQALALAPEGVWPVSEA
ncbi:MAG: phytanoyl-CoA dioxygenase family protein [Candidatus Poribacteria bacterium]|nr:phytanoyl-CoA dioxygenase family protein [Candidatus Poribacteria bacterium]